jgi:nitronate monooxygenase
MGGPARAELVAAVSRAGGFGFLGMVRESPALIEREVLALRSAGIEQFGVNIIPAATPPGLLDQQVAAIIRLRVPIVALFWDLDISLVRRLREAGILVVYQVGSVNEAVAVQHAGADIVIAQGREAGGHVRGTMRLRELLPAVVDAVKVPVLAAGGLGTGGDLLTAMALGADGIVLGTAFLAAKESFAHDAPARPRPD